LIEDIPVRKVSLSQNIGEVLSKVQNIGLHRPDNNLLRDDVSDDPSLADVMGNSTIFFGPMRIEGLSFQQATSSFRELKVHLLALVRDRARLLHPLP
jgi:hypothetical protein